MRTRRLQGFVGMSLAATLTGCTIPANSPFTGLAQIRPVATPHTNVLPPAAMLHHPGPGVEGPGPGIITPASYEAALEAAGAGGPGGLASGGGAGLGGVCAMAPTSQIGFVGPDGMQVRWDVSASGGFDSEPLVAPGRYDFPQGAIYRLKVTDIPVARASSSIRRSKSRPSRPAPRPISRTTRCRFNSPTRISTR